MPINISNNQENTSNFINRLASQTKNNQKNIIFEVSNPKFQMADMVLPQATYNDMKKAIGLRLYQQAIFEEWGFKNTHKYSDKMIINLYGEPGTGKTMAAHAIASELNKKIILINYGDIESKYVGETPKNIHAAFSFAKENNAILFFDEADAILSRRVTNMSNATDTSVNQTRSVMLNILNDYNDTVIFATNFISNYDPAFMRRILMHIRFSLPDKDTRMHLFNKYIPKNLPHSINIPDVVNKSVSLSGSDIANCILLAAFHAKSENKKIVTNEDVLEQISSIINSKDENAKLANIDNIKLTTRELLTKEDFIQEKPFGGNK